MSEREKENAPLGPPTLEHRIEEARALFEAGTAKLQEARLRTNRIVEVAREKIRRLALEIEIEEARIQGVVAEEDLTEAQCFARRSRLGELEAGLQVARAEVRIASAKKRFDDAEAAIANVGQEVRGEEDSNTSRGAAWLARQEIRGEEVGGQEVRRQEVVAKYEWSLDQLSAWDSATLEEQKEYAETVAQEFGDNFTAWLAERRAKEVRVDAAQEANALNVESYATASKKEREDYLATNRIHERETFLAWRERRAKEDREARSRAEKTAIENLGAIVRKLEETKREKERQAFLETRRVKREKEEEGEAPPQAPPPNPQAPADVDRDNPQAQVHPWQTSPGAK